MIRVDFLNCQVGSGGLIEHIRQLRNKVLKGTVQIIFTRLCVQAHATLVHRLINLSTKMPPRLVIKRAKNHSGQGCWRQKNKQRAYLIININNLLCAHNMINTCHCNMKLKEGDKYEKNLCVRTF